MQIHIYKAKLMFQDINFNEWVNIDESHAELATVSDDSIILAIGFDAVAEVLFF